MRVLALMNVGLSQLSRFVRSLSVRPFVHCVAVLLIGHAQTRQSVYLPASLSAAKLSFVCLSISLHAYVLEPVSLSALIHSSLFITFWLKYCFTLHFTCVIVLEVFVLVKSKQPA